MDHKLSTNAKIINMKKCAVCNTSFIPAKGQKYCSKECKDERDYTKRRGPKQKLVCQVDGCDNVFYTRGSMQRFCSEGCNKRHAQRIKRKKLKEDLLEIYGNDCACCGEHRNEFLTLEHKKGNGAEHRKQSSNVWIDAIDAKDVEEYEILCMNCNWSKGKFGYCPHELEDKEV